MYLTKYLVLFVVFATNAIALDANRIADAIYRVEGGAKAKAPYGILSVKVANAAEARKVCLNTIRNNHTRWIRAGKPGKFLDFLADRYCPKSVDPIGNRNWKKNVRSISGLDF
jgi:hypothetical protein